MKGRAGQGSPQSRVQRKRTCQPPGKIKLIEKCEAGRSTRLAFFSYATTRKLTDGSPFLRNAVISGCVAA
jgi:hypothetical protein